MTGKDIIFALSMSVVLGVSVHELEAAKQAFSEDIKAVAPKK